MYTSKGTIGAEFKLNDDDTVSTTLSFVPDHDYSIRHDGKTFAVFAALGNEALIRKYDKDEGVKIEGGDQLVGLYGCTNVKIEIDVTDVTKDDVQKIMEAESDMVNKMKAAVTSNKDQDMYEAFLELYNKVRENATSDGASGLKLIRLKIPAK